MTGTAVPGSGDASSPFREARDFLLAHREDYDVARHDFRWPKPAEFNWALDWFDGIGQSRDRTALWIVDEDGVGASGLY